jgi:hypothetical protein
MSVLGRPQHDWDDFLEEAGKPRRRWRPSRFLWLIIPVAVVVVALIYYFAG